MAIKNSMHLHRVEKFQPNQIPLLRSQPLSTRAENSSQDVDLAYLREQFVRNHSCGYSTGLAQLNRNLLSRAFTGFAITPCLPGQGQPETGSPIQLCEQSIRSAVGSQGGPTYHSILNRGPPAVRISRHPYCFNVTSGL